MNDIIKRDGELLAAICHELELAKRRTEEAEAPVAAIRKAFADRGGVHEYYVGDHGWGYYETCPVCEDVAEAMGDAGRAILDRLAAAEAERDALRAEVKKEAALRAEMAAEIKRLRARTAEMCDCVHATGMIGESFVDVDDDCPKCNGSGAVFSENEE